ncbi:MAG: FtsX-like permease family protein [Terriglobia bacterium]
MPPLAERNLFHDRVRLTVTLAGVVFAVVLIVVQLGLYVGFSRTTTALVDNSRADLWVVSKNVPYIEQGIPFSDRKLYTVRATPGVAEAQNYIVRFSRWKRDDGQEEAIQVVGVNPESTMGQAWNIVAGKREDLKVDDSVFVDRIYFPKLGVKGLGDTAEILGHRTRVVGLTQGIRSFTTSAYVFTNYRNALDYANLRDDQTMFILVKAQAGVNVGDLQRRLQASLTDVDVLTREQFSDMTRHYWMFTTGAGMAVLMAAVLGLLVGMVVVAQTIYSSTMDHIREFGTLKAMGATNGYIYRVIMKQAVIAAVIGYALGISLSILVVHESGKGGANIVLPWQLGVGMLGVTVAMCVAAAFVSINKVTKIDPAMVFKG